ncbi:MAG: ABC transporter permease [Planctomycetota bacterium]|nr:ABC transporter permease [Planctomycetota bacterium]
MLELVRSLRKNQRLLTDLVKRDLRARYVASSMGFFWSVIFPLLNLFVYMFVFTFVLKSRWRLDMPNQESAVLMLAGIIVWQAFAETISRSTNTLVENQNLIQKVVFPSEVLPTYLVTSALINMLIGIAITLLAVGWFAWVDPPAPIEVPEGYVASVRHKPLGFSFTLISLPLLVILQALFTLGYGYFLAALNLFVRDVYHLIGVALTVWMFMTPIFYPPSLVQEAGLEWILKINPMYWLIDSYRDVLVYGLWPKPQVVGTFGVVAIVLFSLGSLFFMRQKPRFPDLL